jgi:Ner family transcriptional regulator
MHTPQPPTKAAPLRAWIKYQLELRGTNLQKLAEEHGLSRNAVRAALRRSYPKGERIIAAALRMKPEQLWPDRYDVYGLPKRGQTHPATTSVSLPRGARRAQGAGR